MKARPVGFGPLPVRTASGYRRRTYDELVALLFPEMAPSLTWSSKERR